MKKGPKQQQQLNIVVAVVVVVVESLPAQLRLERRTSLEDVEAFEWGKAATWKSRRKPKCRRSRSGSRERGKLGRREDTRTRKPRAQRMARVPLLAGQEVKNTSFGKIEEEEEEIDDGSRKVAKN